MSKTSLIIQREYLSRVKNRTFLLTTLLTPLLFVIFIFGAAFLSITGKSRLKVAVIDENGFFKNNLKSDSDITFSFAENVDTINYLDKGYTALLLITKLDTSKNQKFFLRSKKAVGIGTTGSIENKINGVIEDNMLQSKGIARSTLDSIHTRAHIADVVPIEEHEGKATESNQTAAYIVGYTSGMLIYITMLIYGMMLMRGVMEEKATRIAEVIISSVKPFELMMGKIIGIGAVGLTQFLIWIVLIIVLSASVPLFLPHDMVEQVRTLQQHGGMMPGGGAMQVSQGAQMFYSLSHNLGTANWPVITACFIFYFLGGYLFYAALFAAIGCVVEDIQSSQSLTLPVTMPIIFSFIIGINAVAVPGSQIAIWGSIIPFSSPIVMMCRIAYGVPGTVSYAELASSAVLLIAGFLATTWLAGKIYRTGILMYGKKVTWKEMMRWGLKKN